LMRRRSNGGLNVIFSARPALEMGTIWARIEAAKILCSTDQSDRVRRKVRPNQAAPCGLESQRRVVRSRA
jgi:hypothetical protein